MNHCPKCRTPIHSMMLLDGKQTPEFYCGYCDRAVALVRAASAPEPEPALR
jgi:uncharacterized Zn finger protein (UPF0148 family)